MENNGKIEIEHAPTVVKSNSLVAYAGDLDVKLRFCQTLIKGGLVPSKFKGAEGVLSVILMGQELGFSPMQSLKLFNFIQQEPCISAAGLQAVAVSRGGRFTVISEDNTAVTVKAERASNKWSATLTYSMHDAGIAKLAQKDNWLKHPREMLYARCVTILARRGWPDVLGGIKSDDEVEEFTIADNLAPIGTPSKTVTEKAMTKAQVATVALIAENKAYAYDKALMIAALGFDGAKKATVKAIREHGAVIEDQRVHTPTPIKEWQQYLVVSESPTLPDDLPEDWQAKCFEDAPEAAK